MVEEEGPRKRGPRSTRAKWRVVVIENRKSKESSVFPGHFQDDAERSFAPFPQTAAVMMISIMPESSIRGSTANLFPSLYTAAKSSRTLPAMRGYRS